MIIPQLERTQNQKERNTFFAVLPPRFMLSLLLAKAINIIFSCSGVVCWHTLHCLVLKGRLPKEVFVIKRLVFANKHVHFKKHVLLQQQTPYCQIFYYSLGCSLVACTCACNGDSFSLVLCVTHCLVLKQEARLSKDVFVVKKSRLSEDACALQ